MSNTDKPDPMLSPTHSRVDDSISNRVSLLVDLKYGNGAPGLHNRKIELSQLTQTTIGGVFGPVELGNLTLRGAFEGLDLVLRPREGLPDDLHSIRVQNRPVLIPQFHPQDVSTNQPQSDRVVQSLGVSTMIIEGREKTPIG